MQRAPASDKPLTPRLVANTHRKLSYRVPPIDGVRPSAFHSTMPRYAVTPVVNLTNLALSCGVARIAVKNEQERLGLPSFKGLGSSWALHERVKDLAGLSGERLIPFPDLRTLAASLGPPTLCTASDGNHGRAVAALAEALGCRCVVFLPADSAVSRVTAIAGHGANVELVDGSYDEAVATARATARARDYWYCPDTVADDATEDERAFASDVMAGYGTLFEEFLGQLADVPDFLFVQAGVGRDRAIARARFADRGGRCADGHGLPAVSECLSSRVADSLSGRQRGHGRHRR
jgi:diaminopropionate ammonia-lyase